MGKGTVALEISAKFRLDMEECTYQHMSNLGRGVTSRILGMIDGTVVLCIQHVSAKAFLYLCL